MLRCSIADGGTPAAGPGRYTAMDASALPSPVLVVDMGAFEANVAAAERWCRGTPKTIRPHVKAHRTPALALRQLTPGTSGLTCATVGEAEAMVDAGAGDVLVANEVVDPGKLGRLAALARRAAVGTAIDAPEAAEALGAAARPRGPRSPCWSTSMSVSAAAACRARRRRSSWGRSPSRRPGSGWPA
jgi:D-serine deaminase-like pyridoxal phosphate-dependent protein